MLAGIFFVDLHDANPMIRKLVVRSGELELWHMTRGTFVCGHRTSFGAGFSPTMASLALCIIFYRIALYFMMRIMAGEAADSRVLYVVTLTAGQAVRLEANVVDVREALQRDLFPGPVTLTAEIGDALGGQGFGQILGLLNHRKFEAIEQHGRQVRLGAFVTMLALYAGDHFVERQASS